MAERIISDRAPVMGSSWWQGRKAMTAWVVVVTARAWSHPRQVSPKMALPGETAIAGAECCYPADKERVALVLPKASVGYLTEKQGSVVTTLAASGQHQH